MDIAAFVLIEAAMLAWLARMRAASTLWLVAFAVLFVGGFVFGVGAA